MLLVWASCTVCAHFCACTLCLVCDERIGCTLGLEVMVEMVISLCGKCSRLESWGNLCCVSVLSHLSYRHVNKILQPYSVTLLLSLVMSELSILPDCGKLPLLFCFVHVARHYMYHLLSLRMSLRAACFLTLCMSVFCLNFFFFFEDDQYLSIDKTVGHMKS